VTRQCDLVIVLFLSRGRFADTAASKIPGRWRGESVKHRQVRHARRPSTAEELDGFETGRAGATATRSLTGTRPG